MSLKKRILTVGSANMDFVMKTGRFPERGQTLIENNYGYRYIPGGKGANAAITVSRLGGDSVFCARIGADANGQRLKALYQNAGIDTRFLKSDREYPTGLAAICVEGNGDNRIIVYPGANGALSSEDVEDAMTCLPDAVFFQFEIPDEPIFTAVALAKQNRIPVFVDAGAIRRGFPLENLGRMEVFSPNETETAILTGILPSTIQNALRASIALKQMADVRYIVLKLGDRGAFIYDGTYSQLMTPYDVSVLDTTAAGDAFSAAMTLEYLRSGDIGRAVKYANAAAAIVVSKAGASSSIPNEKEVAAFIAEREIQL